MRYNKNNVASHVSQTKSKRKQTIPSYVRLQLGFQEWLGLLGYSHRSVQDLPRKVGIFLDWLCAREGYDIGGISRQDIRDFYKYLRDNFKSARGGYLQPRTLNSYIQALKLWSRYLSETDQGDITVDVMYERTRPYVRDLLTQEDIHALYAVTGSDAYGLRDRVILGLYYGCGLRSREGRYLNTSDVLLGSRLLYVRHGKRYQERYVPFLGHQAQDFRDYLSYGRMYFTKDADTAAFLLGNTGVRMRYMAVLKRLKILQQATGIESLQEKRIGLHTLRHSIATHVLERGMDMDRIRRFLGHRQLRSTQLYTHLLDEHRDLP